jgi:hypothetical protein
MASMPAQMIVTLPDASGALAFCNELNTNGAFHAELASERFARLDRFNRQRLGQRGSPPLAGPDRTHWTSA